MRIYRTEAINVGASIFPFTDAVAAEDVSAGAVRGDAAVAAIRLIRNRGPLPPVMLRDAPVPAVTVTCTTFEGGLFCPVVLLKLCAT
jgi:hypothetical protein